MAIPDELIDQLSGGCRVPEQLTWSVRLMDFGLQKRLTAIPSSKAYEGPRATRRLAPTAGTAETMLLPRPCPRGRCVLRTVAPAGRGELKRELRRSRLDDAGTAED
jgi:hypothetical protein